MPAVTIIKRNLVGEETWRYSGQVLKREVNSIFVEAFFNRDDMLFMDITLKRGDRFMETFYTDRWYNIFEIFDRDDATFKGWYCNVAKPVVFERDDCLSYIDLALDLWVSANRTQFVLDEDEFNELELDPLTRMKALAALEELKVKFS